MILRPHIHFTAQRNWINDPNGCVFVQGVYHLFYQYHPFSTLWGPMHWGHAHSSDLLHWQEGDIALFPNAELGMAFSGSIVIDAHNDSGLFQNVNNTPSGGGLVAIYTRHIEAHIEDGERVVQHQCLSYSADIGKTWKHYAGNPIIPASQNPLAQTSAQNQNAPNRSETAPDPSALTTPAGKQADTPPPAPLSTDFRDPKVFYHSESDHWLLVLAAGRELQFYCSKNLIHWEYASSFGALDSEYSAVYECPDCIRMTAEDGAELWLLSCFLMSENSADTCARYYIGRFNGREFSPLHSEARRIDYGTDFYAAQSWHGADPPLWIAWANHWKYSQSVPAESWRGIMTLPRRLSLVRVEADVQADIGVSVKADVQAQGGGHAGANAAGEDSCSYALKQEPPAQLKELRSSAIPFATANDTAPTSGSLALAPQSAHDIELTLANAQAGTVELAFCTGTGDEIRLAWQGTRLVCDRSGLKASAFNAFFAEPMELPLCFGAQSSQAQSAHRSGTIEIRIILDNLILEVFAGNRVLTAQVFPDSQFNSLRYRAEGDIDIRSAIYYPLVFSNTRS